MPRWARILHLLSYSPGRHSLHAIVEVRSTVPGSLEDVLHRIAQEKINLFAIAAYDQPDSDRAVISMFVEPTGETRTVDGVKKVIDESPLVLSSSVEDSEDGILISKELFPTRLGTGHRVMVTRTALMSNVLRSIRESFGSGGDLIVYNEGLAAGRDDAETLTKLIGRAKFIEHGKLLVQLRTAFGWGRVTFFEFQITPFKATARVEDSFECAGQKSSKPYSQFMRGHFAGLAGGVMGVDTDCKETKCVAKGDAYCEFEIEQKRP